MEAVEEKEKVGVDGGDGVHDRMKQCVGFRCKDSYFVVNRWSIQKFPIFARGLVYLMEIRMFKEKMTDRISRLKQLLSSTITKEFLRFAIVGVVATGIHYGVYLLLLRWLKVNVAYSFGYVISLCCNLLMTSFFTFREKITWKRTLGFLASHGVNYALHIVFLNLFLYLGVAERWAPIPVYCIVIPINFVLVRTAFKKL